MNEKNIGRIVLHAYKICVTITRAATESIIFLVLGIVLVEEPVWHTGFILWSILIVIATRFMWIFALTTYINWTQTVRYISVAERFIMAYGGLRGAIAFALVITLHDRSIEKSKLFTTTTISIVMFTVFLQGLSMKPLMKFLGIRRAEKHTRLFNRINSHLFDHCASGVEEIIGRHGRNYWRELFSTIDDKFIKPCLQNDPHSHDEAFIQSWTKLNLNEHYTMLRGDKDKYSYCHSKSSVAGTSQATLTPSPSMVSMLRTPSKVSLKDMAGGGAATTSGGLLSVRQPHFHRGGRHHHHVQSGSSSNVMSMVGQGGEGCVVTTMPGGGVSDKMRRISSGSSLQSEFVLKCFICIFVKLFYSRKKWFHTEFVQPPTMLKVADLLLSKFPGQSYLQKNANNWMNAGRTAVADCRLPKTLHHFVHAHAVVQCRPYAVVEPVVAQLPSPCVNAVNRQRQDVKKICRKIIPFPNLWEIRWNWLL